MKSQSQDAENTEREQKIQRIRNIFQGLREETYSDPNKKYDKAAHQLMAEISEDKQEELIEEFEDVYDKFSYEDDEGRSIAGTICPVCYEVFKSRGGMSNHRTRKHDTILIDDEEDIQSFEETWREIGQTVQDVTSIDFQSMEDKEKFKYVLKNSILGQLPHTEDEKGQYYGRFLEAFKQGLRKEVDQ